MVSKYLPLLGFFLVAIVSEGSRCQVHLPSTFTSMLRNLLLPFTCGLAFSLEAQQPTWFTLQTDSATLVREARTLTDRFIADVQAAVPGVDLRPRVIERTTPYLIFYLDKDTTVNLPLWDKVPPPLKEFLTKVGGNEATGRSLFAHYFNGFYLPHELGHALVDALGLSPGHGSYAEELKANALAIAWWRMQGRTNELATCAELARTALANTPTPDTEGLPMEEFLTRNYARATQDPFLYGHAQFGQFIALYNDPALPGFAEQVKALVADR